MRAWRRLSIVMKVPVGLGLLLVVVMAATTALMQAEMRRAALDAAGERLDGVSQLLADLFANSARQRVIALQRLAGDSTLLARLSGGRPDDGAAQARLRGFGAGQNVVVAVELWNDAGLRVAVSGDTIAAVDAAEAAALVRAAEGGGVVGAYVETEHGVLYPIVAAVRRDGRTIGAVVERRAIAGSPDAVRQLSELIGSEARLVVGNAAGDLWTDLSRRVPGPAADVSLDGVARYTNGPGTAVLARVVEIEATPWRMALEFPVAPVLARANRTLRRAGVLMLLLALAGTGAGIVLSRRLTLPLERLTEAAESTAAGRGPVHVAEDREDEIGRLAVAFNTMVEKVEEARRSLEQRVAERTRALESANRELEAFSYSVSHDLRAPLRAVDGFAAVLEEDHADELSADARRCLVLVRENAQRMGHLIDDLLTFSRLGRQPLERGAVDMDELARAVVADVCGVNGAAAGVDIGPLPPAYGERSMLRQALLNYVQNAVKFSREREVPRIAIGAFEGAGETTYYVKDNGVGFDMRYVGKLFGVFQRLHAPERFEGTGVGLAIVQRIVQRHGGRVWAEGAPEAGATFYFSLPGAVSAEAAPVREAERT